MKKIVLELNSCSLRREKVVNGGRGRMSGTAVPKSFFSPWVELINMTKVLKSYSSFDFNVRLNVSKCRCFYPKTFMFQDNSLNCELQKVLRLLNLGEMQKISNFWVFHLDILNCFSKKNHLEKKKEKETKGGGQEGEKMEANRNSKNLPKFQGCMNGKAKTRKLITRLQCGSFYLMNRFSCPLSTSPALFQSKDESSLPSHAMLSELIFLLGFSLSNIKDILVPVPLVWGTNHLLANTIQRLMFLSCSAVER